MNTGDEPRGRVRKSDVAVMIGIVAIIDGHLRGGSVDEKVAAKLAARFLEADLLDRDPDGSLPSAGRVAVAMDSLIERLRFALGEYQSEPPPGPETTAHVLLFPTESQAGRCQVELQGDAIQVLVKANAEKPGWLLCAVYPELAPDPGFRSRERALQATAARLGGVYSGSQSPGQLTT